MSKDAAPLAKISPVAIEEQMRRDELSNEPYSVYMVRCSDGSYYVGLTNNVAIRVWEHNEGFNTDAYTYKRRPVVLVHESVFGDIRQAFNWERQLKGWSRAKKEALIRGDYAAIHALAQRYSKKKKGS